MDETYTVLDSGKCLGLIGILGGIALMNVWGTIKWKARDSSGTD
jgi:hypothetical protein